MFLKILSDVYPFILQSFSETSLQYLKDVTTIPLYKILHKGISILHRLLAFMGFVGIWYDVYRNIIVPNSGGIYEWLLGQIEMY